MNNKAEIVLGIIGGGYAAALHLSGYKKVYSLNIRVKTVVDLDLKKAQELADEFGIENVTSSFEEMLQDPEIDVIDIITPAVTHPDMVIKVLEHQKHVICEKPLVGFFGKKDQKTPVGDTGKQEMYDHVLSELTRIREAVSRSNKKFMFAENYVYATPMQRSAELIRKKKSRILLMKGEESLKGSSSPVAGKWAFTGGGSLIRVGVHPLSGILWLKKQEAIAHGKKIFVKSVMGDMETVTHSLTDEERRHIDIVAEDVEDLGLVIVTFSDSTRAIIIASDLCLGGTKNSVEIYCNDVNLNLNLTPTDLLTSYYLDEKGIEDETIGEMLPSKLGWNHVFVSDDVIRGYTGQAQDFMECVAYPEQNPQSDFSLAANNAQIVYAAYLSAERGEKVTLDIEL